MASLTTSPCGSPFQVYGFVDDAPTPHNLRGVQLLGHRVLGGTEVLSELPRECCYVVGIADGRVRERLVAVAEQHQLQATTLVHPHATVGRSCNIGHGTVLWAGVRLTTNVVLGKHVHVNQNVTIGHDSFIDDFATVNPSAAISGSVRLETRSLVGAGAVVLQGLTVGEDAVVGASACVTKNVSPGAVTKGVPAR